MEMIKIGILGVAGVLIALQFRVNRPEISLYMGFAVCVIIFSFSMDGLFQAVERIRLLERYISAGEPYFKLLFKAVGITYICEFCASVCKDAGFLAVAGQMEIFGKVSVLLLGMPVLLAVIENLSSLAG